MPKEDKISKFKRQLNQIEKDIAEIQKRPNLREGRVISIESALVIAKRRALLKKKREQRKKEEAMLRRALIKKQDLTKKEQKKRIINRRAKERYAKIKQEIMRAKRISQERKRAREAIEEEKRKILEKKRELRFKEKLIEAREHQKILDKKRREREKHQILEEIRSEELAKQKAIELDRAREARRKLQSGEIKIEDNEDESFEVKTIPPKINESELLQSVHSEPAVLSPESQHMIQQAQRSIQSAQTSKNNPRAKHKPHPREKRSLMTKLASGILSITHIKNSSRRKSPALKKQPEDPLKKMAFRKLEEIEEEEITHKTITEISLVFRVYIEKRLKIKRYLTHEELVFSLKDRKLSPEIKSKIERISSDIVQTEYRNIALDRATVRKLINELEEIIDIL